MKLYCSLTKIGTKIYLKMLYTQMVKIKVPLWK